jgi:hypothetical protein
MWPEKKDVNYHLRLALISKIKRHMEANFDWEQYFTFDPVIVYTYEKGAKYLLDIGRHKYIHPRYKREFKTIKCKLDTGKYVRLITLRNKHLLEIYNQLKK